MKYKIIAAAIVSLLVLSCKSKVAVTTMQPNTVQVPVKMASPNETTKPGVPDAVANFDAGKAAYENNCAKCHKLFSPSDFTKEEWVPILVAMQKKARLDDTQMAPINNYIYSMTK